MFLINSFSDNLQTFIIHIIFVIRTEHCNKNRISGMGNYNKVLLSTDNMKVVEFHKGQEWFIQVITITSYFEKKQQIILST